MKKLLLIIFFDLLIGTQSGNFGTRNMKNWEWNREYSSFLISNNNNRSRDFRCRIGLVQGTVLINNAQHFFIDLFSFAILIKFNDRESSIIQIVSSSILFSSFSIQKLQKEI
jgi:hypothetical protein